MTKINHIITIIWLLLLSVTLKLVAVDGRMTGDDKQKTKKCGNNNCRNNEYCCNDSCSICSKLDGDGCHKKKCLPPVPSPVSNINNNENNTQPCEKNKDCPKIDCKRGAPCPKNICRNKQCVILQEMNDNKDHNKKNKCGKNNTCKNDEYCCNESCGICAPINGGVCNVKLCAQDNDKNNKKISCGTTTCSKGEYCCNESCGICAKKGESCDKIGCLLSFPTTSPITTDTGTSCKSNFDCPVPPCLPDYPCPINVCINNQCIMKSREKVCGNSDNNIFCNDDEYCCNESCGICAPIGGSCILMACLSSPTPSPITNTDTGCKRNLDCPIPPCLPNNPCPISVCIDNQCIMKSREKMCGNSNNNIFCNDDEYCCNASCGICVKDGDSCDNNDECCTDDSDCSPYICRACSPNVQTRVCNNGVCFLP